MLLILYFLRGHGKILESDVIVFTWPIKFEVDICEDCNSAILFYIVELHYVCHSTMKLSNYNYVRQNENENSDCKLNSYITDIYLI